MHDIILYNCNISHAWFQSLSHCKICILDNNCVQSEKPKFTHFRCANFHLGRRISFNFYVRINNVETGPQFNYSCFMHFSTFVVTSSSARRFAVTVYFNENLSQLLVAKSDVLETTTKKLLSNCATLFCVWNNLLFSKWLRVNYDGKSSNGVYQLNFVSKYC